MRVNLWACVMVHLKCSWVPPVTSNQWHVGVEHTKKLARRVVLLAYLIANSVQLKTWVDYCRCILSSPCCCGHFWLRPKICRNIFLNIYFSTLMKPFFIHHFSIILQAITNFKTAVILYSTYQFQNNLIFFIISHHFEHHVNLNHHLSPC